jgi:hypothetical protein
MIWAIVDDLERVFIYREWPDYQTYGEWAIPSEKMDGSQGPAQKTGTGMTIAEYRSMIRDLERKDTSPPIVRYIDPRAGKSSAVSLQEGNKTLIDQIGTDVLDGQNEIKNAGLYFTPASGVHIEDGVSAVNDLLGYNLRDPISILNEPKLYISEECKNLIYSLNEWTYIDKDKGACKDPADCLRYLCLMDPCHIDERAPVSFGGGTY